MDESAFTVVLGDPSDPWVVRAFPPTNGPGSITSEWFDSFIRSGTLGQQIAAERLNRQLHERNHRDVEEHRRQRTDYAR